MKLFDFFTKKEVKNIDEETNVVPLPKAPEPAREKPSTIFYRFGVTDNNRLSFQMGYSEITMNKQGVQNLINQLEFFKEQLYDEADE